MAQKTRISNNRFVENKLFFQNYGKLLQNCLINTAYSKLAVEILIFFNINIICKLNKRIKTVN